MRITIGTFVLCEGNAKGEYPKDFTVDDEEILQIAQYLRAAASVPLERGNTLTTISFKLEREHADARAAAEYALLHAASIPKTGNVVFQCEGPGVSKIKLVNGKFKHRKVEAIIGCTTVHSYVFQGGGFTTDI